MSQQKGTEIITELCSLRNNNPLCHSSNELLSTNKYNELNEIISKTEEIILEKINEINI